MRCNIAQKAESMHESFVLSWELTPEVEDASNAQDEDGDEPGTPPRNQVSNNHCDSPSASLEMLTSKIGLQTDGSVASLHPDLRMCCLSWACDTEYVPRRLLQSLHPGPRGAGRACPELPGIHSCTSLPHLQQCLIPGTSAVHRTILRQAGTH